MTAERQTGGGLLALAGLVLVILAPVAWVLLYDVAWMQRSGAPLWLLVTLGGGCAGAALLRTRGWLARGTAAVTLLLAAGSVPAFFWLAKLPGAPGLAQLEQAPDFTVPDHTGRQVALAEQLSDSAVLLVFYRGHWWLNCQAELRGFGDINDELGELGVHVLAVSVDAPAESAGVVRRNDLPFPILADTEREVIRAYGVVHEGGGPGGAAIALPAHVLIDRAGKIRYRNVAARVQDRRTARDVLADVRAALNVQRSD